MPDRLRVLIVHEVLGLIGGAEGCVLDGARLLREAGHAVALLHEGRNGRDPETVTAAMDACFTADAVDQARSWKPTTIWFHTPRSLDLVRSILDWALPSVRTVHDHSSYCLREYRYFPWNRQICTRTPGWGCLATCALLRRRDRAIGVGLGWPGRIVAARRQWRRCILHLTNSRYMASELVRAGMPESDIRVLHPCPQPPAPDFRAMADAPRFAFTGQLIRGKGCDQVIAACARLQTPDWRLDIFGDGALRGHLEQQAKDLGLADRISFHGWVRRETLDQQYTHLRLGVVPGMWPEPLGLTGIEFLQRGIPVVAYDVGGTRDWLADGRNGILVPQGDVVGLATAIDRLLGDATEARRLGEAGRTASLEAFAPAAYAARLLACLEDPESGGRALPGPGQDPT